MVPIYKGDWGKLMKWEGYLCYREYYCIFATPPSGTFKSRTEKQSIGLWEKLPPPTPPRTRNFPRIMVVVQHGEGEGDGHDPNVGLVERHDMDETVEYPMELSGGEVKSGEGIGDPLLVEDLPPRPEVGKMGEDEDWLDGENHGGELVEKDEV
jgi:hypothetical protein